MKELKKHSSRLVGGVETSNQAGRMCGKALDLADEVWAG